jgi:hypothetical protein
MKGTCEMVRNHEKLNQNGHRVEYHSESLHLQRICSGLLGKQLGFERSSSRLNTKTTCQGVLEEEDAKGARPSSEHQGKSANKLFI